MADETGEEYKDHLKIGMIGTIIWIGIVAAMMLFFDFVMRFESSAQPFLFLITGLFIGAKTSHGARRLARDDRNQGQSKWRLGLLSMVS